MIAICEECGKKYTIDPEKIKGKTARFNCRACGHRITVTKPQPSGGLPAEDAPTAGRPPVPAPDRVPQPAEPMRNRPAPSLGAEGSGRKNRFGLTEKMISLMLIVTLMPLIVFWGLSFRQTSSRIRNDSETLLIQASERLVVHIDEWMDKNIRMLKLTADLLASSGMDSDMSAPLVHAVKNRFPWIDHVFTLSAAGNRLGSGEDHPAENYVDRPFYKDIVGGKAVAWQTTTGKATAMDGLVIAVPIHADGQLKGILAAVMRFEAISKQIIHRKPGEIGTAFLTDANGKVLAHQVPQFAKQRPNLGDHPLIAAFKRGQNRLISFTDANGTPLVGHVRGTAFGWALAVEAQQGNVYRVLKQAQFFAYIYLGAIMVVVALIALIAGKMMTRPIKALTEAADRISVGELDVTIDIRRKDEIGDLAEALLRMRDSLKLSIERLRRRR